MRYPVKGKGGENVSWFTLIEIKVALEQEAHRLSHETGLRSRSPGGARVLKVAHVINAALSDYLTESKAERDRRARRGQAAFEKLQASDKPVYFNPDGSGDRGSGRRGPSLPSAKGMPAYGSNSQDRRQGADQVATSVDRPTFEQ